MLKTATTPKCTRGWQIHHVALRGSKKQRIAYLETEIMLRPLSTMHMSVIAAVWPRSVTGHCPVSADQIFSCISALPDSTTNPDGKKRHLYTSPKWPSRVRWKTRCTTKGRFTHSMWQCPIHTCHAVPMPCSDHAVLLKAMAQHGRWETACGLPARIQLLLATTWSFMKIVIRSIPILLTTIHTYNCKEL